MGMGKLSIGDIGSRIIDWKEQRFLNWVVGMRIYTKCGLRGAGLQSPVNSSLVENNAKMVVD